MKRILLGLILMGVCAPGWSYTLSTSYVESSARLLEGDGRQEVTVTFQRDAGAGSGSPNDSGACSVIVAVNVGPFEAQGVNNEAVPQEDYTPVLAELALSLSVEQNVATAQLNVAVIDDDIPEPTEFFASQVIEVVSFDCAGDPIFNLSEVAAIPIFDDDVLASGTPVFAGVPLSVGEAAGSATITVNRVGGSAGTLQVAYATEDGTAQAGIEYTAASGTLTWGDGDTSSRQFSIVVADDQAADGDKSLRIALVPADTSGGAVSVTETLTITDDDGASTVQFLVSSLQVDEDAGIATVLVQRAGATGGALTVDYATEDGSAVDGEQYVGVSGTLSWADGEVAERAIDVTILPGSVGPEAQSFSVALFNLTGPGTLGARSVITVSIEPVSSGETRDITSILALTPNQRALAGWFDSACPRLTAGEGSTTEQGDLARICGLVRGRDVPDDEVRQALDAINPTDFFAFSSGALRLSAAQHGNLSQRLNALRNGATGIDLVGLDLEIGGQAIAGRALQEMFDGLTGGAASADEAATWGHWGGFVNGRLSTGEKDKTIHESGFDFDLYNVTGGIDYRIRQNLIVGVGLGVGNLDADYKGRGGNMEIDSWVGSVFLTYFHEDTFYIDALATYGRNDYDSERRILFSIGDETIDRTSFGESEGDQYSVGVGLGWDFTREAWVYGPHAGVYHYNVDVDAFEERGAGSLELVVGKQNVKSMTASAGGHVSRAILTSWGVLVPNARVDWVRELEDAPESLAFTFLHDPFASDPTDPSPVIRLRSDTPDTNYLIWSVGVSAQFIYGLAGFVNYQIYSGYDNFETQEVSFGARWEKTF